MQIRPVFGIIGGMKVYDHKKIEKKWQRYWESKKIFNATESKKPKFYGLIEFPYPSGSGLHVGHIRSNTAMDIISRKRQMEGYNVLYPIGWDAFGLPTENYAIKTGIHPIKVTKQNTNTFRRQLKALGFSFDWSREVNTTDPKYYKWTQWIFLQFYKKGLAYKAKTEINWCPKDKIGLANEEVVGGECERCGTKVEKREKEQWMLAITKYADRLDKDLDTVNYLPKIKIQQRNWIGKSEGAEIDFKIVFSHGQKPGSIPVFTTRADTLFGAFALILSPEHLWVTLALDDNHMGVVDNREELIKYVSLAKKKTEIERTAEEKEKTGVEIKGVKAINPINGEEIPVWIADFVLAHYGTGAVFADIHDDRDFIFAKKYNLPMRQTLMPNLVDKDNPPREGKENTERETVHVILRNPAKKEILIQFLKGEKWEGTNPRNFIIGGVESGENEIQAATREIKEETGYTNVKFLEKIPFVVQANFFAAHKDVNRRIKVSTLVFDLVDEEKTEIIEDQYFTKDSHEMKWIPYEKVSETLSTQDQKMIWEYYQKGGFAYTGEGVLINSGEFDGLTSEEARPKIIQKASARIVTKYKLRDWVFSRQRYWGEPIPVIFCDKCGTVPVPEKDLPIELPKVKNYQPTDSGESPLANITKWVNVKCPNCKGKARRETDTMPNWAGSSWYFLRYVDPKNKKEFASKKNLKYWMGNGIDWYNGGMEHTTLHLLYSRFWHKFLYDLKLVPTSEPYAKRTSHGLILADDGTKFSKSKGNGIDPEDLIKVYGADTVRLYEMFMGPFDQAVSWSNDGLIGPRRFIEKVWRIGERIVSPDASPQDFLLRNVNRSEKHPGSPPLDKLLNKTIKKVSEDIESMNFNTSISTMMILATEMDKAEKVSKEDFKKFLKILSPFAPHVAEELWSRLGEKKSIANSPWPKWEERLLEEGEVKIVIQINGKLRGELMIEADSPLEDIKRAALATEAVQRHLMGKEPKKVIYVKNRLINIVL